MKAFQTRLIWLVEDCRWQTNPVGTGSGETGQPGAVTLSNVAVHKDELLWLVSAKPTYAVDAMVNVAVPCCVQVTPSGERYPVNVFPLRTSLTQ